MKKCFCGWDEPQFAKCRSYPCLQKPDQIPPQIPMEFGAALDKLREGKRVRRVGWNGKGMYIELQNPTPSSKMTLPYIFMRTVQGDLVPWLASQTDLLATDWLIA